MTHRRQDPRNAARRPAPSVLTVLAGALIALSIGSIAWAQEAGQASQASPEIDDPWGSIRGLEGSWEAAIDGRLGRGIGRRRYEFELEGLYLTVRHASIRLPQELSPRGDYHREFGVFSFDRDR